MFFYSFLFIFPFFLFLFSYLVFWFFISNSLQTKIYECNCSFIQFLIMKCMHKLLTKYEFFWGKHVWRCLNWMYSKVMLRLQYLILMHALQGASSSRDHVGSGYAWQLIYDASHGFFSLHIRVNKTIQRDLRFLGHVTSHFKVKQPLECVFIIINIIGNQLVLFEMHDFVSFIFSHITIIL